MGYLLKIPKEQMRNLFLLREYAGCGTIASQVREAIRLWIEQQSRKNGCSIEEIAETLEKHRKQSQE